jgi:hypothetical protein
MYFIDPWKPLCNHFSSRLASSVSGTALAIPQYSKPARAAFSLTNLESFSVFKFDLIIIDLLR